MKLTVFAYKLVSNGFHPFTHDVCYLELKRNAHYDSNAYLEWFVNGCHNNDCGYDLEDGGA